MRATKQGFVGAKEAAGLPDLVMVHDDPPRLVFAELKGTGGKLSDEQREFLQAARTVGEWSNEIEPGVSGARIGCKTIGVYVWEPGQEDAIEAILRTRVLV
jgi:hypothetical protein